MSTDYEMMLDLYDQVGQDASVFSSSDVAHLVIHQNEVKGAALVPGLQVEAEETDHGVNVRLVVEEGARIRNQVHMCFGVLPEEGLQQIGLDVELRDGSEVSVLAHCVFPNAVDVTHRMDAEIRVGEGARYSYFERHVHGEQGGVPVVPRARVRVGAGASFQTEFELIQGRMERIELGLEKPSRLRDVVRRAEHHADDRPDGRPGR